MPDHPVRHLRPVATGEEGHEVTLDLHGIRLLGPAEASGQSPEMGVDGDARNAEGITQHHVGRLATDPRKRDEILEPRRNLTTEPVGQRLADADEGRGLLPEEARRRNQRLELTSIGGGVVDGGAVAGEQGWGHRVDALIGALGAEHGGDEQLQRSAEVELASRVGIRLAQGLDDSPGSSPEGRELLADAREPVTRHAGSVCVSPRRAALPRPRRGTVTPDSDDEAEWTTMDDAFLHAPLFAALDPEGAAALRASLVARDVAKGEVIFSEGQPGDQMYVIVEGKVKLGQTSADGRESLLGVLGPGEMFGELSLFDPGLRTSTATALTDSIVLALGNDQLRPWLSGRPEVAAALLQALARRIRRTNEAMADLVFSDVPGRVAKALMELGEKFGEVTPDGLLVTHDMTQEELAQLVGASRETVNKALADFAQRGWIRLESRQVLILDVERLGKRAR